MDTNTNDNGQEFVTETAPKQYTGAKRGRKPGTKNGEGKSPKPAAGKLKAQSVSIVNDTLYVNLGNLSLRYAGPGAPEFSLASSVVSADYVKAVAAVVASAPVMPSEPAGVVEFGRAIGLGLADFDTLTTIRQWIVK